MYNYFFCAETKSLIFSEIQADSKQFKELENSENYILKKLTAKLNLKNRFFLDDENNVQEIDVVFKKAQQEKLQELEEGHNLSKKITIQNGKTLVIAHDTPERDEFLKLIEVVSNLKATQDIACEYEQETDVGNLGFRILPEIANYIFKDLFIANLSNGTKVNSRSHNKAIVYNNALEKINKTTTQAELDAITWDFLKPAGIVIDVNVKANEMLTDPSVSDFAKAAITEAKDHLTGEIHLVKTLEELAAGS